MNLKNKTDHELLEMATGVNLNIKDARSKRGGKFRIDGLENRLLEINQELVSRNNLILVTHDPEMGGVFA